MKFFKPGLLILSLAFAFAAGVTANEVLDGPTKAKGITSKTLAEVLLSKEMTDLDGRKFRMRRASIAPGGIVPVHSHAGRPGLVYVMSGKIIEHRSDQEAPKMHQAGSFTIEANGISHWWENKGDEPADLVLVDVYKK
ncbi:MAG: cupin domain-containing protein [Hyphomicrobiaceae bacterium]